MPLLNAQPCLPAVINTLAATFPCNLAAAIMARSGTFVSSTIKRLPEFPVIKASASSKFGVIKSKMTLLLALNDAGDVSTSICPPTFLIAVANRSMPFSGIPVGILPISSTRSPGFVLAAAKAQ